MFSALAPRYRLFNRWSSLGLDDRWRRRAVAELKGSRRVLDLGTGTGDLARLVSQDRPQSFVVGMDLSFEMLRGGTEAAGGDSPWWVQGSGDQLPFREGTFDAVVSAFVLRNLLLGGVLPGTIRESSRVLGTGGQLVFLDLTRPKNMFLRWAHGIYGRTMLPFFGRVLFGNQWPGGYLTRSIRALPSPEEMGRLFLGNGFSGFECRPLWGGIVSLFIGKK
jgi:demethylmenaquinone methyltransferase/2-methoxy-6-polyprenyl-1,4-benzoquinol methylase